VHRHNRLLQKIAPIRLPFGALVLLALSVVVSRSLPAQGSPSDSPGCSAAAQDVRAGKSVESVRHGLGGLLECPQSGPPTLAKVWESPSVDPEVLNTLSHASAGIRDMRVLSAVIKSADNAALVRAVRLAALRTLVRLYDPKREVEFKTRTEDGANGPVFVMMGRWTSTVGRDGAFPITQAGKNDILATLDRLGNTDSDPALRRVAVQLRRELGAGS